MISSSDAPRVEPSTRAASAGKLIVACAVHLACTLSLVGAAIDCLAMSVHRVSSVTTWCATFVSMSLGAWVALPLAPLAALLTWLTRGMLGNKFLRFVWIVPTLAIAGCAMWLMVDPFSRKEVGPYVVIWALACTGIAACIWLSRAQPPHLARVMLMIIAATAIAADLSVGSYWYLELHDLSDMVSIAAILAATMPLRAWVMQSSARRSVLVFVGLLIVPSLLIASIERVEPTWRGYEIVHAQNLRRQTTLLGKILDRDRDGFSPIFWGGDCDDADAEIYPGALETEGGGDQNCNGVDRARKTPDSARGLTPAFGEPAYDEGAIDRVVLLTIDTWRADTLNESSMPKLSAFARSGLRFTRAYPGATLTGISVPKWFQAERDSPDLRTTLHGTGIRSRAIIESLYTDPILARTFESVEHTQNTSQTAERGLAAIEESTHGGRHFIWIHFYELHGPSPVPGAFVPSEPAVTSPQYREAAFRIDTEASRVLDRLSAADCAGRTLVMMTGDHGEGFGEHFILAHGVSGYENIVHVPLVLHGPGIAPGRYEHVVSTRGIIATLEGAFGLSAESRRDELFGRSFLRLRDERQKPLHEFAVVYSNRYTSGVKNVSSLGVVIDDRFKVVWGIEDGLIEMYERAADPSEMHDLSATSPDFVRKRIRQGSVVMDLDDYPKAYPH